MAETSRKLTGSFESNKGGFCSVNGKYKIVRPFGRHKHPDLPHVTTDNGGIDIEVPAGGTTRAVFDGTVSEVFRLPGYNTIVMVRHGKYLTIYANLSNISVKKGDALEAGTDHRYDLFRPRRRKSLNSALRAASGEAET